MNLFPLPQLDVPLPVTDESDIWDDFTLVEDKGIIEFPKDKEKSLEEKKMTEGGSHIGKISYQVAEIHTKSQIYTQWHLIQMGVKSRPGSECPFEKYFPMYLMRGSLLKQYTRIPKHEDLISQKQLVEIKNFEYINLRAETTAEHYIQDPDDIRIKDFGVFLPILASGKILKPWKRIIFISHRWLNPLGTPPHPDDETNSKLNQLKQIIRDDDYILMDYMAFPQEDFEGQGKAIQTLCWFIYHCSCYRVVSPDLPAFEVFLGRGWCQLELLSAFCPVLASSEQKRNGNFYLDFENTIINQIYTSTSNDRALLVGDGKEYPLDIGMIKNPRYMSFSIPRDASRIQGVLEKITSAFQEALPRQEQIKRGKGTITNSNTITQSIQYKDASKQEVETLLHLLSV